MSTLSSETEFSALLISVRNNFWNLKSDSYKQVLTHIRCDVSTTNLQSSSAFNVRDEKCDIEVKMMQ